MRVIALFVALCAGTISSQSSAQVSSATPPLEWLYGTWYGRIGGGFSIDDGRRILVVESNGSCRWDLGTKDTAPGRAKNCGVQNGMLTLTTGANAQVVLNLSPTGGKDQRLTGSMKLASGKVFPVTFGRSGYPPAEAGTVSYDSAGLSQKCLRFFKNAGYSGTYENPDGRFWVNYNFDTEGKVVGSDCLVIRTSWWISQGAASKGPEMLKYNGIVTRNSRDLRITPMLGGTLSEDRLRLTFGYHAYVDNKVHPVDFVLKRSR